jgi:hypothetical protein
MGGTFLVQNKVRPGAYINFVAKPQSLMNVSDRGIATLALPMSWGPEGEIIDILSSDLTDGTSIKKIGYSATNVESLLFRICLQNCYRLKAWRLDKGGEKASTTIGTGETAMKPTAKYPGICGNKIQIIVLKESETGDTYTVETLYDGLRQNIQSKLSSPKDLEDNDFVDWNVTDQTVFTATAGSTLTGGTNGTVTESTAYTPYWAKMKTEVWNTMGLLSEDATVKTAFCEYIKDLRENEGVKVQGCVYDKSSYDYEGIVSSEQGYRTDAEEISKVNFVSWVTGACAGAEINESNTHKTIQDAVEIIGELSNTEIIDGLNAGKFLISKSRKGTIRVEKDINTLHTFTVKRSYDFSKNRVIRVLDEMGNTCESTWDENYCGKLDNDADGRNIYKADLVKYGETLAGIHAITNFLGADDIEVLMGDAVDSVVVNWPVQPVDSMEKLYMTFTVGRKDV